MAAVPPAGPKMTKVEQANVRWSCVNHFLRVATRELSAVDTAVLCPPQRRRRHSQIHTTRSVVKAATKSYVRTSKDRSNDQPCTLRTNHNDKKIINPSKKRKKNCRGTADSTILFSACVFGFRHFFSGLFCTFFSRIVRFFVYPPAADPCVWIRQMVKHVQSRKLG